MLFDKRLLKFVLNAVCFIFIIPLAAQCLHLDGLGALKGLPFLPVLVPPPQPHHKIPQHHVDAEDVLTEPAEEGAVAEDKVAFFGAPSPLEVEDEQGPQQNADELYGLLVCEGLNQQ